jgi:hypothetical protein
MIMGMTDEPTIRITVNGKAALTVAQAAARHDLEPSSMRAALSRLGDAIEPAAWLDSRTPLYYITALDKAMAARPGRGRMAESTRRALTAMSDPQVNPQKYGVGGLGKIT